VMSPTPTAVKFPHPVSYTPKHLADKILASKSALEGERKLVNVLFADVKGSMELAEHLDPEVWSQIMQRFFRILCDSTERFEGFVDKFTGDGGMALFGAPIAHEDHAQRACYAALHLRDAARIYASEVSAQHGLPFAVRIGLNSGEVVVGRGTRRGPRAAHGGARRVGAHLYLGAHGAARRGVLPPPGSGPDHGQGREGAGQALSTRGRGGVSHS